MALNTKERRALSAQSHSLKAALSVSAEALTDNVVAHVRSNLAAHRLLKVRIHAGNGEECDAAAAEIARRVPCEVVRRIGRVVLLYWAGPPASGGE